VRNERRGQQVLLELFAREDTPTFVRNQSGTTADGRQAFIGVIDAEVQAELGAR
jgi:hypothetical protein